MRPLRFFASFAVKPFPPVVRRRSAVALAMARAAPGAYSLDAVLGITLAEPATLLIGLVLVALGIAGALLSKPRPRLAARTA